MCNYILNGGNKEEFVKKFSKAMSKVRDITRFWSCSCTCPFPGLYLAHCGA